MQINFKKIKIPIHTQIILALILGVFFGAIFSINQSILNIYYKENNKKKVIKFTDIDSVKVIDRTNNTQILNYSTEELNSLVNNFKNFKKDEKLNLEIIIFTQQRRVEIKKVIQIMKDQTIATEIKPLGTLFINLLSFLAIPLVIASLIVGASSINNVNKLGKIGIKTLSFFITTTIIAISIGLILVNLIQPGKMIDENSKVRLISEYQSETPVEIEEELGIDIVDFFVNIVPKNPFKAMAQGNMLQIVFFAIIFGITLTFIDRAKSKLITNFFEAISETMIKMVSFIMKLAPLGVFALISSVIAEFGFGILQTLIWYILTVVLGLLIHTVIIYGLLVKYFGKIKPLHFFKNIRTAQAIAFSTSSSAATLPVTFDCVENNLNIPKQISGFVLPLAATINMDGTALYQGIAAIFISQVYGMDLNLTQQLTIIITATLASIGTAPVPGVGIIMLVMILNSINVPVEGIALILSVDRILDMCRTITNVSGDASVAVAVWGSENKYK